MIFLDSSKVDKNDVLCKSYDNLYIKWDVFSNVSSIHPESSREDSKATNE
jgi:hypothetical protein